MKFFSILYFLWEFEECGSDSFASRAHNIEKKKCTRYTTLMVKKQKMFITQWRTKLLFMGLCFVVNLRMEQQAKYLWQCNTVSCTLLCSHLFHCAGFITRNHFLPFCVSYPPSYLHCNQCRNKTCHYPNFRSFPWYRYCNTAKNWSI